MPRTVGNPRTLGSGPSTLAALQAMQGILINECLVASASPFAAVSSADATRYGVSVAVFVGKPKDFKDGYLPQCTIWAPPADQQAQDVELVNYQGRVVDEVEAIVTAHVDLRTDWWAGEQKVLQIRDALWPAVLHHERLGGSVAGVVEAWAREGRGLCYEEVAGMEYRCYELLWGFRQEWNLTGGRAI